jgi:hypothetical protein
MYQVQEKLIYYTKKLYYFNNSTATMYSFNDKI